MPTIIVTGAGGNLGKAVAQNFFAEGYNVIGTVLHDVPTTNSNNGVVNENYIVDLQDENKATEFVSTIVEKYQHIDAAVLTAGGFIGGDVAVTGVEDILKQFRLNFQTTYTIARPLFLQMLRQNSGHLFLTGSAAGSTMKKSKGLVAYGLSKSLLFRLAELLNEEAAGTNVKISVIIPTTIDTPENRTAMPHADFTRWTTPQQIAETVFAHAIGKSDYAPTFTV